MRILFLTHTVTWKGGGIFYTAYHQARELVKRGHSVTLLSISPRSRFRFSESVNDGVRIVETPDLLPGKGRSGWDPWDTLRRLEYLQNRDFDLVHGYESRPVVALPGLATRRRLHIPLVLTWADWFGKGGKSEERGRLVAPIMGPIEDFCERYFYPRADGLVAMGNPLQERAISLGIPSEKIINTLHGCDPQNIWPVPQKLARQNLGKYQKDEILVGYLGVMRPDSAELLFKAFQILRQGTGRTCKLILIGNHKLRGLGKLAPANCREDIIETGWLSYENVNNYLSACDLLALPLRKTIATDNVWPSKLNDYLAAGRPVVATRMKVYETLLEEKQAGILTEDNPEDFARGCLQILNDPQMGVQMGRNARALAEGELSWSAIVDQLEKFYTELRGTNR